MKTMPGLMLPHGTVHALGWTLLHFCWQGVVVAGLLWCILALVSATAVRTRYALACGAMLMMALLPLVTLARLIGAESAATPVTVPAFTTAALNGAARGLPFEELLSGWLDGAAAWLPALWAAGLAGFLVRLYLGLRFAQRLKSEETSEAPEQLVAVFEKVRRRLGVTAAVRLFESALVQAPTVIGWLRPVVLMPVQCLSGLTEMQLEALLAHELAHIRRHDYLVSVAQSMVETLLFYHPAVWWVSRQVRQERECCCDALAVSVTADPVAYARALLLLEQRRTLLPEMTLSANGGVLTMRIRRLLGRRQNSVVSQAAALVVLGVVAAVGGLYLVSTARAQNGDAVGAPGEKTLIAAGARGEIVAVPAPGRIAGAKQGKGALRGNSAKPQLSQNAGQQAVLQTTQKDARPAETDGVISGVVYDQTGALVPRAQVKVTNTASGLIRGTLGDEAGNYGVQVPPGSYTIEVRAGGFATATHDNVRVERSKAAGVNLRLTLGSVDQALMVHAAPVSANDTSAPPATEERKPQGALRVSSGMMAGQLLSKVDPVYPDAARAGHISGTVILQATISKEGTISRLHVISGPSMLMTSATDAVRQWTYTPYLLNGEPVEVDTTINVNYSLDEPAH